MSIQLYDKHVQLRAVHYYIIRLHLLYFIVHENSRYAISSCHDILFTPEYVLCGLSSDISTDYKHNKKTTNDGTEAAGAECDTLSGMNIQSPRFSSSFLPSVCVVGTYCQQHNTF
jgi:hypothetical protein